jgi:hypothetical protein
MAFFIFLDEGAGERNAMLVCFSLAILGMEFSFGFFESVFCLWDFLQVTLCGVQKWGM